MVLSLYGLKLFVTNRCTRLDFPTPDASIKQQVAAIINGRYGWPVTEDETRDSIRSQSYARRRAVTPTTLVRLYNVTKGSQIPMVSPQRVSTFVWLNRRHCFNREGRNIFYFSVRNRTSSYLPGTVRITCIKNPKILEQLVEV